MVYLGELLFKGCCMPQVGNKKFPYTPAGYKAAKAAATLPAKSGNSKATTLPAKSTKDREEVGIPKQPGNSKATTLPAKSGKTKKKM